MAKETRSLRVRKMTLDDVVCCAAIIGDTELFREYGYTAEKAQGQLTATLVEGADDLVVALDGNSVLGFAWVVPRGGFARSPYLRLIGVDPQLTRGGVGRALMLDLERRCLGKTGFVLLVTATNQVGRKFYESLGYRCIGEVPGYILPGVGEAIYFKPGSV